MQRAGATSAASAARRGVGRDAGTRDGLESTRPATVRWHTRPYMRASCRRAGRRRFFPSSSCVGSQPPAALLGAPRQRLRRALHTLCQAPPHPRRGHASADTRRQAAGGGRGAGAAAPKSARAHSRGAAPAAPCPRRAARASACARRSQRPRRGSWWRPSRARAPGGGDCPHYIYSHVVQRKQSAGDATKSSSQTSSRQALPSSSRARRHCSRRPPPPPATTFRRARQRRRRRRRRPRRRSSQRSRTPSLCVWRTAVRTFRFDCSTLFTFTRYDASTAPSLRMRAQRGANRGAIDRACSLALAPGAR